MITLICATHRPKNQTQRVVAYYKEILEKQYKEVKVLYMSELPQNFVYADSFGNRTNDTEQLIAEKIVPAQKLIIIAPEYNGSFPGIFKAFLDGVKPSIWKGKKVALVGVASGRAGNLRGLDHLTDICHYLRMEVFSLKVPISRLDAVLNDNGQLADDETQLVLQTQANEFLDF
jgi:NAD(P)H-dependent FMN reductase